VFYINDSRTGFGVFHFNDFEMGFRLAEPSGVFMLEMTAILYALGHIRSHSLGRYMILSDSMSSIMALQTKIVSKKIHPLVFDCKEALWRLSTMGYSVSLAWIPAHVGIQRNKRANALAKLAALEDVYLQASPISSDFIPLARSRIQNEWQEKWNRSEMGRFAYSILPSVQQNPWFVSFESKRQNI
jgi:RNase H